MTNAGLRGDEREADRAAGTQSSRSEDEIVEITGAIRNDTFDEARGKRVPASGNATRFWPEHVKRPGDEHLRDTECFLREVRQEFLEGWKNLPPHCSPDRAPHSTGDWRRKKCHRATALLALIEANA